MADSGSSAAWSQMDLATYQQMLNRLSGQMTAGGGNDILGGVVGGASAGAAAGPWGALIGGVLGGVGGAFTKKGKKKKRKAIEKQRRVAQNILQQGLNNQEAMARLANKQRIGGITAAERATELSGRRATQRLEERGTQLAAAANQSLQDRGLGSTTVGANVQRGVSADTSRQIADVNALVGQRLADYGQQRGFLEAAGTEDLAQIAAQRAGADINYESFWLPHDMTQLGQLEGFTAGGGLGGSGGAGYGGYDQNLLNWIFSSGS